MDIINALENLRKTLESSGVKRADSDWGGAGVIITNVDVSDEDKSYYNDKYVVTEYSLELSWLIEELKAIFSNESAIDYMSKYVFYGRLADAANHYINQNEEQTADELCLAVLQEAFKIHDDIKNG